MLDKYEYRVNWSEDDAAYVARVTEFPSLAAHGETMESALREIKFVVSSVLEDLNENVEAIPEPINVKSYSGKLNVRMPQDLHRQLARESMLQNVSLNQLIVYKLSKD